MRMRSKDKYCWGEGMEVVALLGDHRYDHGIITKLTNTQITVDFADSCDRRFGRTHAREIAGPGPTPLYIRPLGTYDREFFRRRELEYDMKRVSPELLTIDQLQRIVAIINEEKEKP